MACDPLVFTGVDATAFARVQDLLSREYGVRVDSERGKQTQRGFTFDWTYDAGTETLRIQCTHKPFVVPCAVVNNRINQLADKSGIKREASG